MKQTAPLFDDSGTNINENYFLENEAILFILNYTEISTKVN